jgi:antitoxin ParD1/3/4
MPISLPAALKDWVEAQTEDGRYGNSSDFVRDVIRREQVRLEKIENRNRMVEEGLARGISTMTVQEIFAEARREAVARRATFSG